MGRVHTAGNRKVTSYINGGVQLFHKTCLGFIESLGGFPKHAQEVGVPSFTPALLLVHTGAVSVRSALARGYLTSLSTWKRGKCLRVPQGRSLPPTFLKLGKENYKHLGCIKSLDAAKKRIIFPSRKVFFLPDLFPLPSSVISEHRARAQGPSERFGSDCGASWSVSSKFRAFVYQTLRGASGFPPELFKNIHIKGQSLYLT